MGYKGLWLSETGSPHLIVELHSEEQRRNGQRGIAKKMSTQNINNKQEKYINE
jgi:hypothetical protein